MSAKHRLEMLLDSRWTEHDAGMTSTDPLKFVDTKPYAARLKEARKKLGMNDAVITVEPDSAAAGLCARRWFCLSGFDGRSGRRRCARSGWLRSRQPLVVVSCSGRARMMARSA
jgi:acetyl-CoA carboxylase carboxyl transferase subunit beta